MQVCHLGCIEQFLHTRLWLAQTQVGGDRVVEQIRSLRHPGDQPAPIIERKLLERFAIYADLDLPAAG